MCTWDDLIVHIRKVPTKLSWNCLKLSIRKRNTTSTMVWIRVSSSTSYVGFYSSLVLNVHTIKQNSGGSSGLLFLADQLQGNTCKWLQENFAYKIKQITHVFFWCLCIQNPRRVYPLMDEKLEESPTFNVKHVLGNTWKLSTYNSQQ